MTDYSPNRIEHFSSLVRYHRSMAIAYADNPQLCEAHAAAMRAALEELKKIALAQVEAS